MSAELERALELIAAGRLVAYATETVYGLGGDAGSEEALAALLAWKGRGPGQPISILVPDARALAAYGLELPAEAAALAEAFWPGPLTLVLPCRPGRFARAVHGAGGAVGVRCSPHPVASALARACFERGLAPVTSTSLNRSGEPPAQNRARATALATAVAGAPWLLDLEGAPEPSGDASTVVDCTRGIRVLREGALSLATLVRALGVHASCGAAS